MSTSPRRWFRWSSALVLLVALSGSLAEAGEDRWTLVNMGYCDLVDVRVDPTTPGALYGFAWVGLYDKAEPYRSLDGGKTWTLLAPLPSDEPDPLPNLTPDPNRPGTLYAYDSNGKVFRSTDRGASWSLMAKNPRFGFWSRIVAVPGDASTLYLVGEDDLFRSRDRGKSWRLLRTVRDIIDDFAVDTTDSRILYLTTRRNKIWTSRDNGASWTTLPSVIPGKTAIVTGLAVAPTRPSTLFVGTTTGLYRSRDNGRTWQRMELPVPKDYIADVVVDRASPGTVYVSVVVFSDPQHPSWGSDVLSSVHVSADNGDTWQPTGETLREVLDMLEVDPSGHQVYGVFSQSGVLRAVSGGGWTSLPGQGIATNIPVSLEISPTDPETRYLEVVNAQREDRVLVSTDGSQTWSKIDPEESAVRALAIDPVDPKVIYLHAIRGLFKSVNGGEGGSWTRIGDSSWDTFEWIGSLLVPRPGTLLDGSCGIRRSIDDGVTWTTVLSCELPDGQPLPKGVKRSISEFLIDRAQPDTIWAEAIESFESGNHVVTIYRSQDGGLTWRRVLVEWPGGAPNSFPAAVVALTPGDPSVIYVATRNDLMRSGDGGQTWRKVGDLGLRDGLLDLVVDPFDAKRLYAAVGPMGVLRSRDGGATWEAVNAGLVERGRREIHKIVAHPTEKGLFYAFSAGGLFEARFTN